jgi:flavin reductase (DIM6/NTAB) family NADH-FMN oxidoreductase RutF
VLKNAAAVFDCEIKQVIDQFSHSILIGEVMAAQPGIGKDALLYGARRFRTLRKTISEAVGDDVESLHF